MIFTNTEYANMQRKRTANFDIAQHCYRTEVYEWKLADFQYWFCSAIDVKFGEARNCFHVVWY